MTFETNKDVLNWFESQSRILTNDFIEQLPWDAVRSHPLDEKFIPVLLYMRDVETLTDMYHRELQRTPTGKDPHISKFMERWGVEEITHGEVINRFLNEYGIETGEQWASEVRAAVSRFYKANTYVLTVITKLIGRKFTATHMTFGAIHEMTAAQSYRRMEMLAGHPVLSKILNAIIREEAAHTQFYWNVARLELRKSGVAQRLAKFVIDQFWQPVGQASLTRPRAENVINTLFSGEDGLRWLDKTVTQRARQLPGFESLTTVSETIGRITNQPLTNL